MTSEEFRKQIIYKSLYDDINLIIDAKTALEVHALYDISTDRLLAISPWTLTVNYLNECNENTYVRYSIKKFDKIKELDFEINSNKCYLTRIITAKYTQDIDDFLFDELYYFHLIIEKSAAFDLFNNRINHYRRSMLNGLFLQETIYNQKYQEALEIKNNSNNIDESQFPFLREYAELIGTDIQTAAKEVLIQNKIYKTRLNNTETMRIKYKKLIQECSDITQIREIVNEFLCDGELYGRI